MKWPWYCFQINPRSWGELFPLQVLSILRLDLGNLNQNRHALLQLSLLATLVFFHGRFSFLKDAAGQDLLSLLFLNLRTYKYTFNMDILTFYSQKKIFLRSYIYQQGESWSMGSPLMMKNIYSGKMSIGMVTLWPILWLRNIVDIHTLVSHGSCVNTGWLSNPIKTFDPLRK